MCESYNFIQQFCNSNKVESIELCLLLCSRFIEEGTANTFYGKTINYLIIKYLIIIKK